MTNPMQAKQIAIGQLIAHPANVRANSPDSSDTDSISHLKASILALGLIQPLLVQDIDGGSGIGSGVLAGKRRAAALTELALDKSVKEFTLKTKIDCRVIPKDCDVTTALSLAENIGQLPMTALDEFEAYARMMEVDGQSPETIALTFGATIAAVKGRLRFGLVHPDIRKAARDKKITLDAMKAFAGHPSQDVQLEVFAAMTQDGDMPSSWTVKQALGNRGVQVSDKLGAFVREDYEAQGGAIARDLIDEHSVLEDMELVETVLTQKLRDAAEAERAAHGFAWAEARTQYEHGFFAEFGRVYPQSVEPSKADQKRLDEIDVQIETLQTEMEDETEKGELSDEDYDAKSDLIEALTREADNLQEAYEKDDLANSGVYAVWQHDEITLVRGLIRPEDRTDKPAPNGSTEAGDNSIGSNSETGESAKSDEIIYSAALSSDLQAERAMALGAALVQHPEVATDLALFKLVTDVLGMVSSTYAINLSATTEYRTHAKMDEIDGTSLEQVAAAFDALDMSWTGDGMSPAKQFAAFRKLDATEKAKLVAYAVGSTTRPNFARNQNADSIMYDLEQEIMPDIRAHWTPNAALFGRFKKAWLLQILSVDLGLSNEAVQLSTNSKKDIVAFMDKLFTEPFATLSEDQQTAVAEWCPPHMQTAGAYEDGVDQEGADQNGAIQNEADQQEGSNVEQLADHAHAA